MHFSNFFIISLGKNDLLPQDLHIYISYELINLRHMISTFLFCVYLNSSTQHSFLEPPKRNSRDRYGLIMSLS